MVKKLCKCTFTSNSFDKKLYFLSTFCCVCFFFIRLVSLDDAREPRKRQRERKISVSSIKCEDWVGCCFPASNIHYTTVSFAFYCLCNLSSEIACLKDLSPLTKWYIPTVNARRPQYPVEHFFLFFLPFFLYFHSLTSIRPVYTKVISSLPLKSACQTFFSFSPLSNTNLPPS